MSNNECFKCEVEFVEDEKNFECDGCSTTWHLKCAGITKQESNAREKSNRIRLLCDDCNSADPMNVISNNVKTLLKFIYKIDMTLQKQVMASANFEKSISSNTDEIRRIGEQVNMMKNETPVITVQKENTNHKPTANSFVNVVRQTSVLPTVVIQPKDNKQTCEATTKIVKECIGTSSMLVRNTQNIRGGGVVLSCANANDTMKMKQIIDSSTGGEYDVRLPEIKKPRVKISQIHADLSTDEILHDITNKNETLKNAKIEIKKVIRRGQANTKDIIAEVDCRSFEAMMVMQKMLIGWNSCKVDEHIYLKRCFKCCGFSHIEKECKNELACSKCAEKHKSANCNSRSFGCVNCIMANKKYGLDLATEHHAWNRSCAVLQKRIKNLKEYIQYNPDE